MFGPIQLSDKHGEENIMSAKTLVAIRHLCAGMCIVPKKQGQIGGRVINVAVVIVVALLLIACAAPAAAPAAAPEAAATEPVGLVQIVVWAAIPNYAMPVLEEQLVQFKGENPDFEVVLIYLGGISYDEVLAKTATAIQAGDPPDMIAVWSHAIQQLSVYLEAPENLGFTEDDDFLPAALESNTIEGQLSGLPWFREQPCSPFYYGVAIPLGAQSVEGAAALAQFLTRQDTQVSDYKLSNTDMLPTRMSAYAELGFECPPSGQYVVLPPEVRGRAVTIANERVGNLQEVLDKNSAILSDTGVLEGMQRFSPNRSTAIPQYEAGDGESEPTLVSMYIVATPVEMNFSREAFDAALQSESGVIVGALFGVDQPMQLVFDLGGEYTINPNEDLAVKWRWLDSKAATVYFVMADGSELEVGVTSLGDLKGEQEIPETTPPGSLPFATLELGSCNICYYVDFYNGCATVSNSSVSGFASYIRQLGGEITYLSCSQ